MPRGRPKSIAEWVADRKQAQEQRTEERTKLLPPDLAAQIIEAADREHALVVARIDAIDAEIERLEDVLAETRATEQEQMTEVWQTPPRVKRDWRGEERIRSGRRGLVKGPDAIEAGKKATAIARRIAALKSERVMRRTKIREIAKVRQAAEQGVVSALLSITADWRNRVYLGDLAPRVMQGRVWVDVTGEPLPEEALDKDGKPLPTPKVPARGGEA